MHTLRLWSWIAAAVLGAALVSLACGSSGGAGPAGGPRHCSSAPHASPGEVIASENGNGQCTDPPFVLTGDAGVGAPCQAAEDCVPTCCACATGSKSALVADCVNSVCATPDQACCGFEANNPMECQ